MSHSTPCPHLGICSTLPAHVHFHAVASFSGIAALRTLSINHHSAGLASLQHLSLGCEAAGHLHQELSRRAIESIVLKTCNRTEVYWRARVPGDDETVRAVFAEALGVTDAALHGVATGMSGEAAATHLFRVCSGLESLVLGEAEILGQVRAALEACPGAGPFLDGVFRAALRTGRQARAETGIGAGALSVASTGVQWIAEHVMLAASRVVVIGAGDTGTKVARHLKSLGARQIVIVNRTVSRAEGLARTVGADEAGGLDALPGVLAGADAVVCAAGAPEWIVTREMLARTVSPASPLVIVDLAMPAATEPCEVAGLTRIDLEGLEHLAELNRRQRSAEVPAVMALIARELDWLRAWARHQALRPLVSDLRRKVESIRRTELARAELELAQAAEDPAVLDRLSRRLLDQILSIPLAQLEAGDLPLDATHAEYLRRLFALTDETAHAPQEAGA